METYGMVRIESGHHSYRRVVPDLRGILLAFATALAMWLLIIVAALGLILKILR
jgi:hypothetical protein